MLTNDTPHPLASIRAARQITVKDLAHRQILRLASEDPMSPSAILKLERGEFAISVRNCFRLKKALNLNQQEMLALLSCMKEKSEFDEPEDFFIMAEYGSKQLFGLFNRLMNADAISAALPLYALELCPALEDPLRLEAGHSRREELFDTLKQLLLFMTRRIKDISQKELRINGNSVKQFCSLRLTAGHFPITVKAY